VDIPSFRFCPEEMFRRLARRWALGQAPAATAFRSTLAYRQGAAPDIVEG
jgi:hypothetical protein